MSGTHRSADSAHMTERGRNGNNRTRAPASFAIALLLSIATAVSAAPPGKQAARSLAALDAAAPAQALRGKSYGAPEVLTSAYEFHEPTNGPRNQQFGGQVALSGDGRTLAVSDLWYFGGSEWPWYGSGAVYVYRRVNAAWVLQAKLEPPAARGYDFFGSDIALSVNGDTLAVGAQYEGYDAPSQDAGPGAVFIFKRRNRVWTEEAMLRSSSPQDGASFGRSVELSALGNVLAVGAPYEAIDVDGAAQPAAGAVHVFARREGVWTARAVLTAPAPQSDDLLGMGVRLSEDGRTIAALAAEQNYATEDFENGGWPGRTNTVYVFERASGRWDLAAQIEGAPGETFLGGTAYEPEGQVEGFDLSGDGRTLAIASPFAAAADGAPGLVRLYRRTARHWTPTGVALAPALPERRSFGLRVTLSADGRVLAGFAVRDDGAYGHPYVFVFERTGPRWRQTATLESPSAPNASGFANSLTLSWSGKRFALGARTFATDATSWGAALIY